MREVGRRVLVVRKIFQREHQLRDTEKQGRNERGLTFANGTLKTK